jgi:hypothetical protein
MTMRERWNRFLEHYPSMGLTSTSDRRLTAVARAWIFRPIYDDGCSMKRTVKLNSKLVQA